MLRTTIIRSNLLKETAKKVIRNNVTRVMTVECSRRRYHNRKVSVSILEPQKWHSTTLRYYASNLPPHTKVKLPALSPTMETGNIVSWAKKEGDKLNEGDLLAEIETDKATMGFETPEEGYLAKILIPAGSKGVPIGKLVCIIVPKQADVAAFKDFKDDSPATPAKAAAAPSAAPPSPVAAPPRAASPPPPPPVASPPAGGRVYASPMAKRLAEQRNIRLQGKGTGLFDSITSRDLDKLTADTGAPAARPSSPTPKVVVPAGSAFVDIPVTTMRGVIARRLLQSKQNVPHYYVSVDVVVDNIMSMRQRYNKKLQKKEIKLSVNDFIVKAAAMALIKVPEVNSQWMDNVIRQFRHADISIAVATEKGLITPIVFEADRKGILQINEDVKDLAARARDNSLAPQEFQGGTFTISNLGMFGVAHFTAIINNPQCCILAVGTTRNRLVVDDQCEKGFRNQQYMTVTLSADHRVVDGAVAAKWLAAFRSHIEEPESMIM